MSLILRYRCWRNYVCYKHGTPTKAVISMSRLVPGARFCELCEKDEDDKYATQHYLVIRQAKARIEELDAATKERTA